MTVAAAQPHTDAVVTLLETAGVLVGRGEKPGGGGWQGEPGQSQFVAYAVLYPSPGHTDGDLCDPNEYLDYSVQVTTVAATCDGANTLMDIVKTTLVGVRPAVAGRSSYLVYIDVDRPSVRDDAVAPPQHYAVVIFRFRTGPA